MENGYDDAEVTGQRLLSRHQVDAPLLKLEAPLVDNVVFGNDLFGENEVAVLERVQRLGDGLFDHSAECQKLILEISKVSVEVRARHDAPP